MANKITNTESFILICKSKDFSDDQVRDAFIEYEAENTQDIHIVIDTMMKYRPILYTDISEKLLRMVAEERCNYDEIDNDEERNFWIDGFVDGFNYRNG